MIAYSPLYDAGNLETLVCYQITIIYCRERPSITQVVELPQVKNYSSPGNHLMNIFNLRIDSKFLTPNN